MDLRAYREEAEAFIAELGAEYHAHFAGRQAGFAVDTIYARHADLFALDTVLALRDRAAAAPADGDAARRLRLLLDFAVEGCLGVETKDLASELARREAQLKLPVAGGPLGLRAATVAQANEPDRARRAEIEAARLAATEAHLNPLHREALERTRALAARLGWPSYRAMCAELKEVELDRLAEATAAFSRATGGAAYRAVVEPALRATVGVGLDGLARADLPFFFRAREADAAFPADALLPTVTATLRAMGIDVAAQPNVDLDVEPRPRKSPRAFCAPVRVPGDVRLVVAPVGGRDDYVALLHEAGHAEHFAHIDPALPFEYRQLGDNAVTEAFAFLFDHLAEDGAWLARRLGVADADGALAAHARAARLIALRRYCGKLAYELVAYGEAPPPHAELARVYADALSDAVGVPWPAETYLTDVDGGFYVAAYLRAWALETHLRAWLRERFGACWFERREAGDALRRLWREGQRRTAEELLAGLTGERLRFDVMAADLGLGGGAAAGAR